MQPFLSLLFVLHVADPGGKVPEAHVGVLRLRQKATKGDTAKEKQLKMQPTNHRKQESSTK